MNDRMQDGNTAALLVYEREQARRESFMEEAEKERSQLVEGYMADDGGKHERDLQEYLADLIGQDSEFLHAFQRCDLQRMRQLFRHKIDFVMGDELVQKEADRLDAGGW